LANENLAEKNIKYFIVKIDGGGEGGGDEGGRGGTYTNISLLIFSV